jgi:hypothetical protein
MSKQCWKLNEALDICTFKYFVPNKLMLTYVACIVTQRNVHFIMSNYRWESIMFMEKASIFS